MAISSNSMSSLGALMILFFVQSMYMKRKPLSSLCSAVLIKICFHPPLDSYSKGQVNSMGIFFFFAILPLSPLAIFMVF